MPCNSDYMEATGLEREMSRVYCLLEEIKTGKPVIVRSPEWEGYHPKVYNRGLDRKQADAAVAELCDKLSETKDVSKYSLEMQTWWRDHQKADRARLSKECKEAEQKKLVESAKKKLTKAELSALTEWIIK